MKEAENEELIAQDPTYETRDQNEGIMAQSIGPSGIGGWLVLVAIGRVLAPLVLLVTMFTTLLPPFFNGTLETLSQPGSQVYSIFWKPTFFFELISNVILFLFGIVLIFLFFGKKRSFPKMFVALLIFSFAIVVVDVTLLNLIQKSLPVKMNIVSASSATQIIRPLIGAAIWIPYMLTSERVKNTFVK